MGVYEMPLVHCTYLIRSDVYDKVAYRDESIGDFWEFVVFSASIRRHGKIVTESIEFTEFIAGIPQYIDNRYMYGYLLHEDKQNPANREAWRKLYYKYVALDTANTAPKHFSCIRFQLCRHGGIFF